MARGRPATTSSQKEPVDSKIKSKSKARKAKGEVPSGPSLQEFAAQQEYHACIVDDTDKHHHTFRKNDTVAILPNGCVPGEPLESWEFWMGKIKEIRGIQHHDGSSTVFAKVQWFYNAKDVGGIIKSFNPLAAGKYERIISDHYDLVEPEAFDGIIPMYKFNEEDPEQAYIPQGEFFRRYTFEYRARNIKPRPGAATCICHKPYNPDDDSQQSLMHFCPRPSCRRAYHHKCLNAAKSKESSSTSRTSIVAAANGASIKISTAKRKTEDEEDDRSTTAVTRNRSAQKRTEPVKRGPPKRTKREVDEEDNASLVTNEASSSVSVAGLSRRALRLLACSPDTDDVVNLQELVPFSLPSALNGMESEDEEDEKNFVAKTESSDEISDIEPENDEPPKKRRRGRPPKAKPKHELGVIKSMPKWKTEHSSPETPSCSSAPSPSDTVKKPSAFASPTVKKPSSFIASSTIWSKQSAKSKSKSKSSRTTRTSKRLKPKPIPMPQPQRVPLANLLSALPSELLRVATQPMVRGGAFVMGGVSGNVGIVTRARRLVYAYLADAGGGTGGADVEAWEEKVFAMSVDEKAPERAQEAERESAKQKGKAVEVSQQGLKLGLEHAIVKIDGSRKVLPPFVCPECKSAI